MADRRRDRRVLAARRDRSRLDDVPERFWGPITEVAWRVIQHRNGEADYTAHEGLPHGAGQPIMELEDVDPVYKIKLLSVASDYSYYLEGADTPRGRDHSYPSQPGSAQATIEAAEIL